MLFWTRPEINASIPKFRHFFFLFFLLFFHKEGVFFSKILTRPYQNSGTYNFFFNFLKFFFFLNFFFFEIFDFSHRGHFFHQNFNATIPKFRHILEGVSFIRILMRPYKNSGNLKFHCFFFKMRSFFKVCPFFKICFFFKMLKNKHTQPRG